MQLDPRVIGRMTLGEFAILFAGWREANGVSGGPRAPTQEQFDSVDWDF